MSAATQRLKDLVKILGNTPHDLEVKHKITHAIDEMDRMEHELFEWRKAFPQHGLGWHQDRRTEKPYIIRLYFD